jgi:hypothetical protein
MAPLLTVPRRQPSRRLAALTLALAMPALAACGGDDGTIDDPKLPYSFTYPDDFQAGGKSTNRAESFDNQTIVARKNGQDLIAVQTQPLRRPVTPKLVKRVRREVEQSARRTGKVKERSDTQVAGLEGVKFEMSLQGDTGVPVGAQWIYAAKDRTLYWINCQWQNDRPAVLKACDEVVRSFRIRTPSG